MLNRIIKSFSALVFGQILTRLGSLILVPIFLHHWGVNIYGEWITIWAIVGYINLFDVGIQQATINLLTKEYARGNLYLYKEIQGTSLGLFILIALSTSIIAIILAENFNVAKFFNIVEIKNVFPTVFVLLAVYLALSLPNKLIISYLQTIGKLHLSQWIQNSIQLSIVAVTLLLLYLDYDIVHIATIPLLIQLFGIIFILIYIRLRYPDIFPKPRFPNKIILQTIAKPSFFFFLIMLANIIWFQGTIMIVSIAYGGIIVSMFTVVRTLVLIGREFTHIVNTSFTPEITRLDGQGFMEKNKDIHNLIVIISTSFVIVMTGFLWTWGIKIIEIWTLNKIFVDDIFFKLMLVLALFQTPYFASSSFVLATNKHSDFAKYFFFSQVFGIITVSLLIKSYGLSIIPISFIFWEGLFCYHFVLNKNCKLLNINYTSFSNTLWTRLIIVTILSLSINFLTIQIPIKSSILLISLSFLLTVIFVAVFVWYLWMNSIQKKYISDRFKLVKSKTPKYIATK